MRVEIEREAEGELRDRQRELIDEAHKKIWTKRFTQRQVLREKKELGEEEDYGARGKIKGLPNPKSKLCRLEERGKNKKFVGWA